MENKFSFSELWKRHGYDDEIAFIVTDHNMMYNSIRPITVGEYIEVENAHPLIPGINGIHYQLNPVSLAPLMPSNFEEGLQSRYFAVKILGSTETAQVSHGVQLHTTDKIKVLEEINILEFISSNNFTKQQWDYISSFIIIDDEILNQSWDKLDLRVIKNKYPKFKLCLK